MMMASACVDTIGVTPESFLDLPPYPSYGWLSPRISFSRDFDGDGTQSSIDSPAKKLPENPDLEMSPEKDFEFRLEDPVAMLPADELFSDGKLMPLQAPRPVVSMPTSSTAPAWPIREPAMPKKLRRGSDIGVPEFCAISPKAPRCSSRWRELLGLKRQQSAKPAEAASSSQISVTAASSSMTKAPRSLKQFLRGGSDPKSCTTDASSLSLPLLSAASPVSDSEIESVSASVASSRFSLSSSSSSCPEHEEPPRFSLDSDKPGQNPNPNGTTVPSCSLDNRTPPRVRVSSNGNPNIVASARARVGRSPIRRAPEPGSVPPRGLSVDSPRMNSSGKIVFQGLERSSSSPSTFNGGPRNMRDPYYRHRDSWKGMERSYSANVRVTPILNVPVCSLRASGSKGTIFGLFSQQRKDPARSNKGRSDRV
ncbi:uncharacterized protein LOC116267756 [Nymphaea colorata]|uniref:uncharacterized protein LOC116267756 n=1 Tax=Nymphaea colorata TaxID=210225 RepID=UPI00129D8A22|nr:uncharacterized protein LOC116267756 [Nymphaea colorata]